MKSNTKSSVTLPAEEVALVEKLRKRLGAKTKVEVIRRGLRLLRDQTDRERLRAAYERAAAELRDVTVTELSDLEGLVDEGLDD